MLIAYDSGPKLPRSMKISKEVDNNNVDVTTCMRSDVIVSWCDICSRLKNSTWGAAGLKTSLYLLTQSP